MPLNTQVISIPFNQGVDSKTDPKLSAKPSRMENAVFVGGTIQKRPGTRSLPNATSAGTSFARPGQIYTLNNELVRTGFANTYGFASDAREWIEKDGGGVYVVGEATSIRRNTSTQQDLDHCSLNGVTWLAWTEASGPQAGTHVAVMDEATGAYWQSGSVAIAGTATFTSPRCVISGGKIAVLITDQTNGKLGKLVFSPEDPTSAPAINLAVETNVATPGNLPSPLMDCIQVTADIAIGAYVSSGNSSKDIVVFKMVDGTISSTATFASAMTSGNSIPAVSVNVNTNGNVFVFFGGGSSAAAYVVVNTSLGTVLAKTAIGGGPQLMSSLQLSAGSMLYVASNVTALGIPLKTATVNESGVTAALASVPLTDGVTLCTEAFVIGSGTTSTNVVGVNQSANDGDLGADVQPTSWLVDVSTGNPVARFLTGLSAIPTSSQGVPISRIPRAISIGGQTSALFPTRGRLAYSSQQGRAIDVTPIGFERVLFSAVDSAALPSTKISRVVYVGGWLPRSYDGLQITEAGLPVPPVAISATPSGSDGFLSAGDYQMCGLWSWVDAAGQLIRSPVSPTISFTASDTNHYIASFAPLPASSRDLLPQGASVQLEVYRTEANGSILYRDSPVNTPVFNNASGSNVSFTGTQSDADLINGELLYTTGGVLDWLAPPPYTISCDHKQRLIVAGLEDPYAWQSSTQEIAGEVVRFNESLGGFVPRETGAITGLASMDGNLIIFVEQGAYLVTGDGPDDLGNNNWPSPQLITSVESGAVSWQSVVPAAGAGVFFQSNRGFMLLDRGLGCTYIGADVQQFSNYICRSGLLVASEQRVRFLVDLGSDLPGSLSGTMLTGTGGWCLVYDYFYRQWSVFPNYGGQSATMWNGNYTRIQSNGTIRTEAPGTFKDDGLTYSSYVETPWIKVGGVQGFERLYLALILGTYSSNFTFNWGAAYNYVLDYSSDTLSQNGQGIYDVGSVFQVRRRPRIQKCEAVKFLFWDSNLADSGAGMSLTDLSLEIGVKKGAFRLPATRSI